MAMTVAITRRTGTKSGRVITGTAFTNENYVTAGFAVTPNQMGLDKVDLVIPSGGTPLAGTSALLPVYDNSTSKFKYYWVDTTVDGALLAEVPNATAIGLIAFGWVAFGI